MDRPLGKKFRLLPGDSYPERAWQSRIALFQSVFADCGWSYFVAINSAFNMLRTLSRNRLSVS